MQVWIAKRLSELFLERCGDRSGVFDACFGSDQIGVSDTAAKTNQPRLFGEGAGDHDTWRDPSRGQDLVRFFVDEADDFE